MYVRRSSERLFRTAQSLDIASGFCPVVVGKLRGRFRRGDHLLFLEGRDMAVGIMQVAIQPRSRQRCLGEVGLNSQFQD